MAQPDYGSLTHLAEEKEREWRVIERERNQRLVQMLEEKSHQLDRLQVGKTKRGMSQERLNSALILRYHIESTQTAGG